MKTKFFQQVLFVVLLAVLLSACGPRTRFVAPEIEPPADLIPAYVPEGFKLISGFQLTGKVALAAFCDGDGVGLFRRLGEGDPLFSMKSPAGNAVQGVYYQGKDHLILIAKSYFPGGTLDLWQTAYEAAEPKPCECECDCVRLCLGTRLFPLRFHEIREERTIDGTRVVILNGLLGWITVFVRGDYLLTVESGISLEENLKIVASLLGH